MDGDINTIIALASPVLAVAGFVRSTRRDRDAESSRAQRIEGSVQVIDERTKDTNATVREMSRQLGDHSLRIERMEARQEAMGERIGQLERTALRRREDHDSD